MSVDIVNLIENNPITKLNGDYHSKLIEKVKNNFSNYEQQLFVASFYCYLNYDFKNDFVIDLDNVWKWLGFSQKYHAKYLLEKQFNKNIDFKIFAPEGSVAKKNNRGGHNKEIILLNVDTFKKICLKAGTKKADEIHDYFIKLEKILQDILHEESNELKIQLQQKNIELETLENKKKQEYDLKLEKQKVLEREKILLNEYKTIGAIVYIIRVKTFENGSYIIKIGESRKGNLDRYKEHKSKYEECLLLDCFLVEKSKDFESFLHNHLQIRGNRVHDLEGHETELELFLIGKNLSYSMLSNIINSHISNYNYNINHLLLENEQLKSQIQGKLQEKPNEIIEELVKTIKTLSCKIDNLEKSNNFILEKMATSQMKAVTGFEQPLVTLGPRLQKINPETMELIQVYESVSEAIKENSAIKRPTINKSITENTIYCGYRELNPHEIHCILPTKATKIQNNGYIAKLNKKKTEIINVYLDRKTAAKLNNYESSSALDNPVKNFTLSKEHYYQLYDCCNLELQINFENKYGKPFLYKNGVGQFDLQHNLIKEFMCKYECIKTLKISDKTLTKALEKKIAYNGSFFKEIGEKLCVLP